MNTCNIAYFFAMGAWVLTILYIAYIIRPLMHDLIKAQSSLHELLEEVFYGDKTKLN